MRDRDPDFRKWIEAGYRDYGKDPWFFIRELAQNSRDAGASSIRVKVEYTPLGEEILIFEDNGGGMSYEHAVKYLFRLYASSKAREKYAAGLFGIGFWTVLKFNPVKIIIESWFKGKPWGIEVDVEANLATTPVTGHLKQKGTRVTLIRRAQEASAEEFWKKTRTALVRYCSYLRRNTRRAEPLPVYFSDENITGEMRLPGPVSVSFKNDLLEGAVGLGPRPRVRLYARGLPVWEGTSLEELSHMPPTPSTQKKQPQEMGMAQGLAPVFLLNGSQLEVNISRRRVIDNRNLQKVRKTAERELAQMVEAAVDCVSPRSLKQRCTDMLKRGTTSTFRSFTKILLLSLIVILPLEYFLVRSFYKGRQDKGSAAVVSLKAEKPYYSGASVRVTSEGNPLDLNYDPPNDTWFKIFTADEYRISSGFLQTSAEKEEVAVPSGSCSDNAITVELNLREAGKIFLPQPVGHVLVSDSLTLNGTSPGAVHYYTAGEVVVFASARGIIRYRCCPVQGSDLTGISPARQKKLIQLPEDLLLPLFLEKALLEFGHFGIRQKVQTALRLTTDVLKYDDSFATAQKYARSSGEGDWFQRVFNIGAGDCDILNGVTVLFLRRMGVPAQLVIGLVGREGRVLPGLHAWTEYFDNEGGWQIIDATRHAVRKQGLQQTREMPGTQPSVPGTPVSAGEETGTGSKGIWLYKPIIYSLMAVLFLLVVSFFVVLSRVRGAKRSFQPGEHQQVEEDLAGMVLHELLHPGVWGREGGLRNYKLIPTINKKMGPISLGEALKLGTQGRLFTYRVDNVNGNNGTPLLDHLQRASVPILDSGNPAFAPVIKILPGAVHLEQIFDLKVVLPEESTHQPINRLLTEVNQLLNSINSSIPPCLSAWGLGTGEIYDVDLSSLPSFRAWGIPNRFIMINPGSSVIKELVQLYQSNPRLAQFRLITLVLKESGLMPIPLTAICKEVSRLLLTTEGS